MLEFIGKIVTERKVRLFAVACCRRIDRLLPHKAHRIALDVAEQFADGIVSLAPLEEACGQAKAYAGLASWAVVAACMPISPLCPKCGAPMSLRHGQRGLLFHECSSDPKCPETWPSLEGIVGYATSVAAEAAVCEHTTEYEMACNAEVSKQAQLMRDIIGNPFHPASINPAWLTPTAACEERAFPSGEFDPDRLAVLADALEEVGCENAEILAHLRSPGPHVRGCWPVDLILGKE
jgi:hypothetical protein